MDVRDPGQQLDLIGCSIGQYRILERIGRGGMGEVYRAEDLKLHRPVAIKRMRGDLLAGADGRSRFMREARIASKLVHPCIATVFDVVEHGDAPLIVMEHIEGRPLQEVVREERPDPEQVRRYALQVTEAVSAIHKAGFVHRDLKPTNVMILPSGHVKVMDFGLSGRNPASYAFAAGSTTLTFSEDRWGGGTPAYMSPEQIRGLALDHRSDLFSLGIIIYESLTGVHPFRRETPADTVSAILNEAPRGDAEAQVRARSHPLGRIALKLLEKQPNRRYPRAEDLEADLRALPSGGTSRRLRLLGLLSGAAGLVLLTLAGRAWLGTKPRAIEVPGRPTLAVLPLAVHTGEQSDSERTGQMIAGLVTAHLSDCPEARSIAQERVHEVAEAAAGLPFSSMKTLVAQALTAQWIVNGQVFREHGELVGTFELHDINGQSDRSFTVTDGRATGLAGLAAQEIRRILSDGRTPEVSRTALLTSASDEAQALYHAALAALRRQDLREALELSDRARSIDPGFVAAALLHVELLHAAGYEERARQEIGETRRLCASAGLQEGDRQWALVEAAFASLHNDLPRAADVYSRLIAEHPDEPEMYSAAARVLERQGEFERALARIDEALVFDGFDPALYLRRAELLATLSQHEAAARALEEAERLYGLFGIRKGRGAAAEKRAYWNYKGGDYDEARAWYDRARAIYEEEGLPVRALAPLKSRADMDLLQWKLEPAIQTYLEVVPLAREAGHLSLLTRVLTSLGAAYMRARKLGPAEERLAEAVQLSQELERADLESSALNNLASVLNLVNRLEESVAVTQRALLIARSLDRPEVEASALLRLGDAHRRSGKLALARHTLSSILDMELKSADEARLECHATHLLWQSAIDAETVEQAQRYATDSLVRCREAEQVSSVAYSLSLRARTSVLLGLEVPALADIAEAGHLMASIVDAPLIRTSLDLAELAVHVERAEWDEVIGRTAGVMPLEHPEQIDLALVRGTALFAAGRHAEAIEVAGELADHAWTPRPAALSARLLLARCELATGARDQALSLARAALEAAQAMERPLSIAEASALMALATSEGDPVRVSYVEQSRAALERYLSGVAEEHAGRVLEKLLQSELGRIWRGDQAEVQDEASIRDLAHGVAAGLGEGW